MNFKHGMAGTTEHRAWKSAKGRCYNKRNPMFKTYGGRGIKVCDEWKNNFKAFFDHIGHCPEGLSLDRIDNDRGYEPGNVRWANDMQQASNKTNNRIFTICCQTKHLRAWAAYFGVSYKLTHERIQRGWPILKALNPGKFKNDGSGTMR